MGELSPMPHEPEYDQYEKVFTPERRMENFEIEQERIDTLSQLIREDIAQIWREHGGRQIDWPTVFKAMQAKSREEYQGIKGAFGEVTPIERDLLAAFWGMYQMMLQARVRPNFEAKRQKMVEGGDLAGQRDVEADVNELNIRSADWQMRMVNSTFALRGSESGRNFTKFIWQSYDDLADAYLNSGERREARALRNGVRGAIAAVDIFERLGFEVYASYPKQDALKKIDLWVKKGANILALQVKSHQREQIMLKGEVIRSYRPEKNLPEEQRKEARQQNQLLTNSEKYGINWRSEGHTCRVLPYWLDLAGGFTRLYQDEAGVVDLPEDFLESEFAQKLDQEVGGTHAVQ